MKKSLKNFKKEYLDLLLNFHWRQWKTLGVSSSIAGYESRLIDPEALLISTCTIGRYEPRLFDEMIDWLDKNGRFINIQRLKTVAGKAPFAGRDILAPISSIMAKRGSRAKWKRLSRRTPKVKSPEPLFYKKDGKPMTSFGTPDPDFKEYGYQRGRIELRGRSGSPGMSHPANLALKLRSLLGVSARCEILLYLLTHESGHPSLIARETYFGQRTIHDTLNDMICSGLIQVRSSGRQKHYWLVKERWASLLADDKTFPEWVTWPLFFSALERVWLKMNDQEFLDLDALLQASELRRLMGIVKPDIEQAGFSRNITDPTSVVGEEYTPVFMDDITALLGQ